MNISTISIAAILASLMISRLTLAADTPAKTINIVVVTGGHGFDEKEFPKLFAGLGDIPNIKVDKVDFKALKDEAELFDDISNWKYDVIVFYHMTQKITEKRRANFLALLDKGVGVVALHHCIGAFQDWPDYANIIGGKHFTKEGTIDGKKWPVSLWKDDVKMTVHVEADHPITAGIKDFTVIDESYKNQWHDPDATLLLSTVEATQDKQIAWAKTFRKANVCYIQLGHGPAIYTDPTFRQLVSQAIRWAAKPVQK
ncbi:MAG: ThuA domain-containing protein [Planctomycetota bacterium]|nr:ThuA domain-containing protein [Planctomycetota bacterium]